MHVTCWGSRQQHGPPLALARQCCRQDPSLTTPRLGHEVVTLVVTEPPCIATDTVTVVALVVVVTVVTMVGAAATGGNKIVPTGAMLGLPADGATSPTDIGVLSGLPADGVTSLMDIGDPGGRL
ncbi:unnamed protein product, partial [Ectocarpus sp. 12 AP-2014]